MDMNKKSPDFDLPVWFDGKSINEALFCEEYLQTHKIIYANGAFFTPDGRVTDELPLRSEIFELLKSCAVSNIPRKISNIMELMKLAALVDEFSPTQDKIHLANGTLLLNGTFTEDKSDIVRNRLPIAYDTFAATPVLWLDFLKGLLFPEDIPTLQEFIGYCLIPSNKGQRMMVIKGNGGEGKSQIGSVLSTIFGSNIKDGSIGKISENRFARADLEKKGKQSYQGWMFARLLAFSNGDLQSLYDRSDGFYRRQLVLTTKGKPTDRRDDPDLAEKMKLEVEGILPWAIEGLQRLVRNNFKFTESERVKSNREAVKRDSNSIFDFMESEDYVRLKTDAFTISKELYAVYCLWCDENLISPLKSRTFSDEAMKCMEKYHLEHTNKFKNAEGRRAWGFLGTELLVHSNTGGIWGNLQCTYVPEEWQ